MQDHDADPVAAGLPGPVQNTYLEKEYERQRSERDKSRQRIKYSNR